MSATNVKETGKIPPDINASQGPIDSSFYNMHAGFLGSPELYEQDGSEAIQDFFDVSKYLEKVIDLGCDMAEISQQSITDLTNVLFQVSDLSATKLVEYLNLVERFLSYAKSEGCDIQAITFPVINVTSE